MTKVSKITFYAKVTLTHSNADRCLQLVNELPDMRKVLSSICDVTRGTDSFVLSKHVEGLTN